MFYWVGTYLITLRVPTTDLFFQTELRGKRGLFNTYLHIQRYDSVLSKMADELVPITIKTD